MIDIHKYIKTLIELLKQHFNSRLLYVCLQGSYLRNEATKDSDIDIYYEGKADILLRSQMKMELEKILQCPVDIVRKRERQENSDFEIQVNQDIIYV